MASWNQERLSASVKVRLAESDWEELQRIARLEDRPATTLIRRAVRFYLIHGPYERREEVTHG